MYINHAERSIVCKICFHGPAHAGKGELVSNLYTHFAAVAGEHTGFEERRFAPPSQLTDELGAEGAKEFIANAEASMGASYEDLENAGVLVWFRTRVSKASAADQFDVYADAFTVSGPAASEVLQDFALAGADCVVFVADARETRSQATLDAWHRLHEHAWAGPTILFVNGTDDPSEIADLLGHEGDTYAEAEGFDETLLAFDRAARVALQHARNAN